MIAPAARLVAFALLLAASPVLAGDLVVLNGWTRALPPGASVGAGYLTIVNGTDAPDRLVAVRASFARGAMLHDTATENGVMRMTPLADGLSVGAAETVRLEPGGPHLMFTDVFAPPRTGERVSVTLVFERAGAIAAELQTVPPGAPAPGR